MQNLILNLPAKHVGILLLIGCLSTVLASIYISKQRKRIDKATLFAYLWLSLSGCLVLAALLIIGLALMYMQELT